MIILHIPQSQADEFLDHALRLLDTAADYAQQCADILVAEYGAKREKIHSDLFKYSAIYKLANGQQLRYPHDEVRNAIQAGLFARRHHRGGDGDAGAHKSQRGQTAKIGGGEGVEAVSHPTPATLNSWGDEWQRRWRALYRQLVASYTPDHPPAGAQP